MNRLKMSLSKVNKKKLLGRMLTLGLVMLAFVPVCAQSALAEAATTLNSYKGDVRKICYAIGAITGLIGGVRIYNKWNNGDQDINKEIVGWSGACLFLFLMPTFLDTMMKGS